MDTPLLEACMVDFAHEIKNFLAHEGGNANGYKTYVSGKVTLNHVNETLHWSTPRAIDELTTKGKDTRADALILRLKMVLRDCEVSELHIRAKDVGYAVYETSVYHVVETKERVML